MTTGHIEFEKKALDVGQKCVLINIIKYLSSNFLFRAVQATFVYQ